MESKSKDDLKNTKWVLANHPDNYFIADRDARLEVETLKLHEVGEDEVLIRVNALAVDAFVRTMLDPQDQENRKAFHGAVGIGSTIPCLGVGTVMYCPSGKLKKGALVYGMLGSQSIAKVPSKGLNPIAQFPYVSPQLSLNLFGASGLTAYGGMNLVLKPPRKGETVVVSAAAGATGSIAAQLAKIKGARVVGIAGGPAKQKFLLEEVGLDASVDYKSTEKTLEEQLDEACPDGIDFFYDNVGGPLLDAILERLNKRGRIVICGAVSQYGHMKDKSKIHGPSNYLALAEKTAQMAGFVLMELGIRVFLGFFVLLWHYYWGNLKNYETVYDGIDSFPEALEGLMKGKNKGKPVVKVTGSYC